MNVAQEINRFGLEVGYTRVAMPFNRLLLAQLRERAVLTQKELARRARISHLSVHYIESGKQSPRPSTIRALARALGVKPGELMSVDEG